MFFLDRKRKFTYNDDRTTLNKPNPKLMYPTNFKKTLVSTLALLLTAGLLVTMTGSHAQQGEDITTSSFFNTGLRAAHATLRPAGSFWADAPGAALHDARARQTPQFAQVQAMMREQQAAGSVAADLARFVRDKNLIVKQAASAVGGSADKFPSAPGYPGCVTTGTASSASGNLPAMTFGRGGDLGHASACKADPNLEYCVLTPTLSCAKVATKPGFNESNPLTWGLIDNVTFHAYVPPPRDMQLPVLLCAGQARMNSVGVCYNKTLCGGYANFEAAMVNWTAEQRMEVNAMEYELFVANLAQNKSLAESLVLLGSYWPCYYLEAAYHFGGKMIPDCNVALSKIEYEIWCDWEKPMESKTGDFFAHSDADVNAVQVSFLVLLSVTALATFVGLMRRVILSLREEFGERDDNDNFRAGGLYQHESLMRASSKSNGPAARGFLDKFLLGVDGVDDDGYAQTAARANAANESVPLRQTVRTSAAADEPDDLYKLTIGGVDRSSTSLGGGYQTGGQTLSGRYDNDGGNRGGDCCDTCWSRAPRKLAAILDCFDVISGLQDFAKPPPRNPATAWLDGVRVCAMALVVTGHVLYFQDLAGSYQNAYNSVMDFGTTYRGILLFPSYLAVDTFFFMSGFLGWLLLQKTFERIAKSRATGLASRTTNLALRPNEDDCCSPAGDFCFFLKRNLPIIISAIITRWLRLVIPMLAVVLFATRILPYWIQGPLSRIFVQDPGNVCNSDPQLWTMTLFVSNVHLRTSSWIACATWFWYLYCDMQIFIFLPFTVPMHVYISRIGYWWKLFVPILLGCTTLFLYAWAIHKLPIIGNGTTYLRAVDRATPYAFGALAAVLCSFDEIIDMLKPRKWLMWLMCFLSVGIMVAAYNLAWEMGRRGMNPTGEGSQPLTEEFHRGATAAYMLWGLALLNLCLAARAGFTNFVFDFLGHNLLSVLGKLTFAMYLLHPYLISARSATQWEYRNFTSFNYYVEALGFLGLTGICALVLWVLVERPTQAFVKWLGNQSGARSGGRR